LFAARQRKTSPGNVSWQPARLRSDFCRARERHDSNELLRASMGFPVVCDFAQGTLNKNVYYLCREYRLFDEFRGGPNWSRRSQWCESESLVLT
jgi:hypothetical protein